MRYILTVVTKKNAFEAYVPVTFLYGRWWQNTAEAMTKLRTKEKKNPKLRTCSAHTRHTAGLRVTRQGRPDDARAHERLRLRLHLSVLNSLQATHADAAANRPGAPIR